MKIEISFDDGTYQDQTILGLLERYNLKAVFYIPIESWGYSNLDQYDGHEIGGHTYTHPSDLKLLSDIGLDWEIIRAKSIVEAKIEKKMEKFCFPRGRFDDRVLSTVRKAGFKEARTTRVLSRKEKDPLVKDTAVHFYQRKEYNDTDWLVVAEKMLGLGGDVLRFWGHSEEVIRCGDLKRLEVFFKMINEGSYC